MGQLAPNFGIIGRFFGNAVSAAAGYAFGAATAPVLAPELELLRQAMWHSLPHRVPDVGVLASGLAQGKITPAQAQDWGQRHGFHPNTLAALVALATAGPPLGQAVNARRRLGAAEVDLHTVYKRHAIGEEWWPSLDALIPEILEPAQLAAAIHRGLVPDPGLLQGEQPTAPFKVDAYPVYPVDPLKEAEGSGFNRDRLGVLVGLQGLPMGTHEAAQALFRNIITHGDYIRAFNTSNSRNEWAGAVLEQTRQIPTARDFLENALRGYRNLASALAGAALHGMSAEHATMIYQNQGRPMAVRLITQALSRGGRFQPEPGELADPYDASIVEGNLKPAYYDLAKALRYTLPSPFAMRQLATSGVWDEAKTAQRLKDLGWLPADADQVAAAWAGGTGGASSPLLTKANSRLYTVAHNEYLDGSLDDTTATTILSDMGATAAVAAEVLSIWQNEAGITRLELTPAQIKKAYTKGKYDQAFALAELIERGMTAEDALTFLTT